MAHPLFEKHRQLLEQALAALERRDGWNPYADSAAYPDAEAGRQALDAYRGAQFYLDQPGLIDRVGEEASPYGLPLDISYPRCSHQILVAAAKAAAAAWLKAGPETRAGVCAEILAGLNARVSEIGQAVMHTTGQSFPFAFHMGGPQAQVRGLEAVAAAYREMSQVPPSALWERGGVRIAKRFTVMPRGVALVIASATSPLATAYAGLFASLATGNPVIVKPHPAAVLPLAITVAVARQVLKQAGFEPDLVSLLVDAADAPIGRDVAVEPDVRIVDYVGTADFGRWLEESARQAVVFAQKAGVNCAVVDSTDDYTGMLKCLAVALCLNSGQLGTTPKVIFVPAAGVGTPAGGVDADAFGRDLAAAVGRLLDEPGRALDVLGALRSPAVLARLEAVAAAGDVLREPSALAHPQWPQALV
ncbi:MAG TPA: aldehyde dehydrogenase family protein, partial [Rhodocyclaceae bacterium]|nr:aldehyde dehydrogenase family protein [Rhodocyclaceae bacterium]